jgi:hypothetical protein
MKARVVARSGNSTAARRATPWDDFIATVQIRADGTVIGIIEVAAGFAAMKRDL